MSNHHPRRRHRPTTPRANRRLHLERCHACGQVLAQSNGCPAVPYPTAYRWGDEAYFAEMGLAPLDRCPDCWATLGQPHHQDCIRAHCQPCDDRLFACAHAEPEDEELIP